MALVAIALPFPTPAAQTKNAPHAPSLHRNSSDSDDLPPTPEDAEERKHAAARAELIKRIRAKALAEVESAAKSVASADPAALAKTLSVEASPSTDPDLDTAARSALRQIGDLDGDGTPEAVVRWSRVERFKVPKIEDMGSLPGWVMFLLAWDGARWRVTELMTGDGLSGVETLDGLWPGKAIVVVEGLSSLPYPVLFRYQDHAATVAWDSRSDESRYQAYAGGSVEFREREEGPPAMIVNGRADPGVIRFLPGGSRGFEAATVYFWEQEAYVPKRTEFEENEDYTLYRFIAALHLRDFKAALACIDPSSFLEGRARTPEALRKVIDETWPEFEGNTIFDALEAGPQNKDAFAFAFEKGGDRYIYYPTFSADGKLLLTGLERRKR